MTSINPVPILPTKKRVAGTFNKNKLNWLLYILFSRNVNNTLHFKVQEFNECSEQITKLIADNQDFFETAVYIKGLIARVTGNIQESFELLKKCHMHNDLNVEFLKQLSRTLFLLGKPKSAIEVANEAQTFDPNDWELYHTKGLSYMGLGDLNSAIDNFKLANQQNKHEATYLQLTKAYMQKKDLRSATVILTEALEYSLENPDILNFLGLLYLKLGESLSAFQFLGNCLSIDSKHEKSILAMGAIMQERGDFDAALMKYKVVANNDPNSALLWNNIGMCFFGKQRFIAAVACLKKAFYLDPFQWSISFNLGVVHYSTEQYASAFHFFNNTINLKPDMARAYMYLGLTLYKLEDYNNSKLAFQKAMQITKDDYLILCNYCIILAKTADLEKFKAMFGQFDEAYRKLDSETKTQEAEVTNNHDLLSNLYRALS